jgi:outer membrane protein assembly factor BamB
MAQAEDWPQWLGPRRDGSSTEKVAAWKEPLKVLWTKPVGEGHSSPVVADGKVYLLTKVKDKSEEQLSAVDALKGDVIWEKTYERTPFKSLFGNGPRGTPAVVDGKVYTFGITGVLTCWDVKTGDQVWQVDTLKKFDAKNLFFGLSGSPLIDADKVLVNVGGKGASIVAFDKKDGGVIWKTLDDGASYSSPSVWGKGDERQAIFLTGKGLVGVAARDGSVFWQQPFEDKLAESSTTPVILGDTIMASSVTLGSIGTRMDNTQAIPRAKEIWKKPELTCYFSTPVPVGKDHIYAVISTKVNLIASTATLHCLEAATGKTLWKHGKVGTYHASLLRTGDDKLLMVEEGGTLVLIDPSAEKYQELCRSKICGNTWAHPALANGRLYIRDDKNLVCVQLP